MADDSSLVTASPKELLPFNRTMTVFCFLAVVPLLHRFFLYRFFVLCLFVCLFETSMTLAQLFKGLDKTDNKLKDIYILVMITLAGK